MSMCLQAMTPRWVRTPRFTDSSSLREAAMCCLRRIHPLKARIGSARTPGLFWFSLRESGVYRERLAAGRLPVCGWLSNVGAVGFSPAAPFLGLGTVLRRAKPSLRGTARGTRFEAAQPRGRPEEGLAAAHRLRPVLRRRGATLSSARCGFCHTSTRDDAVLRFHAIGCFYTSSLTPYHAVCCCSRYATAGCDSQTDDIHSIITCN